MRDCWTTFEKWCVSRTAYDCAGATSRWSEKRVRAAQDGAPIGDGASKIVYRSVFSVKVCRTFDKNILTLLTYAKNAKMVEKWDDKQSNPSWHFVGPIGGAKTKMKTKKLNRQSLS
jgi:hypothetical protein